MKDPGPPVLGITAPPPRPTFRGTLWLACALSAPVFMILFAGEMLVRLVFL